VADEKVFKIEANIGGSPSDDNEAAIAEIVAEAMRETAESAKKVNQEIKDLLSNFTTATQDADPIGAGGRRGGSRAGAGRKGVPKPPPFVKAPPMPGDGDGSDPDENLVRKKTRLAKALTALQKVVMAVDGTNGRTTKALAVVNRGYQALHTALVKQQQATAAAAAANNAQAGATTNAANAAGNAAAATTKMGAVATAVAATLGTAATITAGFTVAIVAATVAAKILIRIIDNLQEVAGQFSLALTRARVETQLATMQAQMRAAGRVGGDLGALEDVKKGLIVALTDMKSEIVGILEPFFTLVGDSLTVIIEALNVVLKVVHNLVGVIEQTVEIGLKILTYIPGIGKAAQKALEWMRKDEIDKIGAIELNTNVEKIFDQNNFFPNSKKNSIPRRFLP
jgi:hypothetical protein